MSADSSLSILIVDDSATMVRIVRDMLGSLGFEHVDEAHGGNTALEKMRTKRYGLVISDWSMEPMTGYDLLKEVRADPAFGEIPFIMVTAASSADNVIAAKKAGANDYIVKPYNALTMWAKIEAVFANEADRISAEET